MLERDHKADLLLVALRVLLVAASRIEVEPLDELGHVARVDPATQVREVGDRVGAGEAVVEIELTGQVSDATVDRHGVLGGLDPEYLGTTRCRADEVEQDAHRRGLACAVGAQEAEDLARFDVEVDLGDPAVDAVGLGELLGVDDRSHAGSFLPVGSARSRRKRSTMVGTSRSTNAKTSRISSSRRRDAGGRSAMATRPRSAISRNVR